MKLKEWQMNEHPWNGPERLYKVIAPSKKRAVELLKEYDSPLRSYNVRDFSEKWHSTELSGEVEGVFELTAPADIRRVEITVTPAKWEIPAKRQKWNPLDS